MLSNVPQSWVICIGRAWLQNRDGGNSSLHWLIFLLKLLVFVQWSIIGQKGSNGDGKLHFFERDYDFTHSLCAKIHLWAKIRRNRVLETTNTLWAQMKMLLGVTYSIIRKGHKQNQNKLMETAETTLIVSVSISSKQRLTQN